MIATPSVPRLCWRLGAWGGAIVILVLSLVGTPDSVQRLPYGSDKFFHAIAHATLMLAWCGAYRARARWQIGTALLCYGAMIEGLQYALPWRSASLGDLIANATGILIMLALLRRWHTDQREAA